MSTNSNNNNNKVSGKSVASETPSHAQLKPTTAAAAAERVVQVQQQPRRHERPLTESRVPEVRPRSRGSNVDSGGGGGLSGYLPTFLRPSSQKLQKSPAKGLSTSECEYQLLSAESEGLLSAFDVYRDNTDEGGGDIEDLDLAEGGGDTVINMKFINSSTVSDFLQF